MIARVEQMVMEDRRLTVRQIAANAGISVGSVDIILHDDLKLRKDSARWVPRMLTDVLFHHDNAPPHRAARVHQFFADNNFEVVPHAPYSPDLAPAPSDFWLFLTLKDTLRGRTSSSI
jgi:hypothetical protein